MVQDFMGADKAVAVSPLKIQPPSLMFHLDQAMIILPNGVAGITHVVGKPENDILVPNEVKEVELFLSELRTLLIRLGYKVVNIDTSVDNILNHQYYVNAIPHPVCGC